MPDTLAVTEDIAIPLADIEFTAVRSQGAGGQNVNKVASAIQLRFDIRACRSLPDTVKERLLRLPDRRVTAAGEIVIKAQEFRQQEQNRAAALERLAELVSSAASEPRPRRKTRPPAAEKRKRVDQKRRRGDIKRLRRDPADD